MSKSLEAQLRHSRHEAGQLQLLRVANEDELRALKDRLAELTGKVGDQMSSLTSAAGLAGMYELLQKDHASTVEALALAESKLTMPHTECNPTILAPFHPFTLSLFHSVFTQCTLPCVRSPPSALANRRCVSLCVCV